MGLTGLTFLIAFAGGCILALGRRPIFGLVTYTAVFYLHPPSRWWGAALPGIRWSLVAALVTLLAVVLAQGRTGARPILRNNVMIGMLLFLAWIAVQSAWALDSPMHLELLELYAKYVLLIGLIAKCIVTERDLRLFLWTHVLGCFYLGWIVFTTYIGGRFEDFGGPDIGEANAGGLQIVTGVLVASSLFLAGGWGDKMALFGTLPFIVNALVATISRSAFVALACGGIIFNWFAPSRFRGRVFALSLLGLVLFVLLTNPLYWSRIASLSAAGEEVEGVDTGSGRLTLIAAQWQMFKDHPFGCGHRCTAVLSPQFLEDRDLTGEEGSRERSSHNTFMTLLVEQGIPGAVFYAALLVWIVRSMRRLRRRFRNERGFLPTMFPAVAAILGSIIIGDMFVDYLKLEVRMWFVAILIVMLNMKTAVRPEVEPNAGRPGLDNQLNRFGARSEHATHDETVSPR